MTRDALIRACERLRGIPESDVRDYTKAWDRDVVIVRLWNHRRVTISGYELVRRT